VPAPPADITRFSHACILGHDRARALADFRRAGFLVTDGMLHPSDGASEDEIRFATDYLVLLALHSSPGARPNANRQRMAELLDNGFEGLASFGLRSADLDGTAGRLARAGLDFVRDDLDYERAGRAVRRSILFLNRRLWCEPWPFIFQAWADGGEDLRERAPTAHPNGALRCVGARVGVPSRAEGWRLYEEQLGLAAAEDSRTFLAGRFRIQLAATAPAGLQELTIAVSDLDQTCRFLDGAGLRFTRGDAVWLDRGQCHGAALAFVPSGPPSV